MTQEKIENLQYVALALTVAGQVTIGANYFVGQGCYMLANVIAVYRNVDRWKAAGSTAYLVRGFEDVERVVERLVRRAGR